jgi:mono/diheme cytochrome c family protein
MLLCGTVSAQTLRAPGIGRPATPAEVAAWDIDVRADFKGLPKGSGSVAAGQDVWEAKCASCHGIFGESGEVFNPLVGGTTAADLQSGRTARLTDPSYPGRTTLMKLPTLSTLWDYIRRAMPWNAPKSLSNDEVYAVTAYMLNLGRIVADDFVLSDANIWLINSLRVITERQTRSVSRSSSSAPKSVRHSMRRVRRFSALERSKQRPARAGCLQVFSISSTVAARRGRSDRVR